MENLPQDRLNRRIFGEHIRRFAAVVIGGSAGGVVALGTLVAALPPDFPLPIIVVLHQHPDSGHHLHEYLSTQTSLPVVEAEDKMPLTAGTIHCAPANYHLLMESDTILALSVDEKVNYARPSIDMLFFSAAEVFDSTLIGVILTGANNDGAHGLAKIAANGGLVIVQSPQSSQCPVMPVAALQAAPGALVLDLEEMATKLVELILNNSEGT